MPDHPPAVSEGGWLSRERAGALTLIVATGIVLYACYRLILPFLPAIAWALALAVIAHPLHRQILRWIPWPNLAAVLAVIAVAVVIVAPAIFVTHSLVRETAKYTGKIQEEISSGRWRTRLRQNPYFNRLIPWVEAQLNLSEGETPTGQDGAGGSGPSSHAPRNDGSGMSGLAGEARGSGSPAAGASQVMEDRGDSARKQASARDGSDPRETQANLAAAPENAAAPSASADRGAEQRSGVSGSSTEKSAKRLNDRAVQEVASQAASSMGRAAQAITGGVGTFVSGTLWLLMQLFITLMSLFFFFRDRHHALGVVRSLMPLSHTETDEVFARVDDTIHATIFGSLVVALVQGIMGGLMFWWLGLPAPLMWGAVMALLAVVPVLGTFVVWAPTAIFLAFQGDWTKALILASWGGIAIALVDNFLYPFLVGKRLRFHTLLVFFAIVGGLSVFGASGLILGPLVLACANALLHVWRRRTAYGHAADEKPPA